MDEAPFASRASALLERGVDRGRMSGALAPARLLLPLFALHHLSGSVGTSSHEDQWRRLRNRVVHARGPEDRAEKCLGELAAAIECELPALDRVFTARLLPDLAPFEALLPFWIMELDRLGRAETDGAERFSFAAWFDEALDELAMRTAVGVQQWATPRPLADLTVALMRPRPDERVADVCYGLGTLLAATARADAREAASCSIPSGQEIDPSIAHLAKLRLFLLTGDATQLHVGDALRRPAERPQGGLEQYDVVFAHPPFGHRLADVDFAGDDPHGRFRFGRVGRSTAELTFAQHAVASLKPGGRAAILLPPGPLFRGGGDVGVREALVREDLVEAVIGLPAGLLPGLSMEVALLVVNSVKPPDRRRSVLFIDASGEREAVRRDPVAWESLVGRIRDLYRGHAVDEPGLCATVTTLSIESEAFSLQPRAYVVRPELPARNAPEVEIGHGLAEAAALEEQARACAGELDRLVTRFVAGEAEHDPHGQEVAGSRPGGKKGSHR